MTRRPALQANHANLEGTRCTVQPAQQHPPSSRHAQRYAQSAPRERPPTRHHRQQTRFAQADRNKADLGACHSRRASESVLILRPQFRFVAQAAMSQRLLLWLTTGPEQMPEPVAPAALRCSQVRESSSESADASRGGWCSAAAAPSTLPAGRSTRQPPWLRSTPFQTAIALCLGKRADCEQSNPIRASVELRDRAVGGCCSAQERGLLAVRHRVWARPGARVRPGRHCAGVGPRAGALSRAPAVVLSRRRCSSGRRRRGRVGRLPGS